MNNVQKLRTNTAAPITWCKQALEATKEDYDAAVQWLRKKGLVKARPMQNRIATEGSVSSYIHMGGKIGVLLEVNCQTDFVARTDDFKNFCKDVAMHIAGRDPFPLYVSEEEIPAAQVEKERTLQTDKARESGKGKPDNIIAKIVDGSILKWKKDICLLDQEFVKDPTKDIRTLMLAISAKTGEKITVRRFTRYALGEGLPKEKAEILYNTPPCISNS